MLQTKPRAHGLDTLRSVAIVSVMTFHVYGFHGADSLPPFLLPAVQFGWMGVDLFFVLSGYLITVQFLRPYLDGSAPRLWLFYRNRLYRILPAYLATLLLYLTIPAWRGKDNLPPLWEMLTFTQNLFVNYDAERAFSHVWSLCVEEHFYLILPIIVLAMMRKPSAKKCMTCIGGFVVAGICVRAFILLHWLQPIAAQGQDFDTEYLEHIYYPTYSRLDGLLVGVALALVRSFRPAWWEWLSRRGHILFTTGAGFTFLACYLFKDRWESVTGTSAWGVVFGFPILSLGLGLLVVSALSRNGWLRWRLPGAQLTASLAYSLYLTHKALIHVVDRLFPWASIAGWGVWLPVYVVTCLLAAAILYVCVERPFLMLRDRRANTA